MTHYGFNHKIQAIPLFSGPFHGFPFVDILKFIFKYAADPLKHRMFRVHCMEAAGRDFHNILDVSLHVNILLTLSKKRSAYNTR